MINYKKLLWGGVATLLISSANAVEVKIDNYGYVGALYNQGFVGENKNSSTIGLSARAGANFYLDNGLTFGLGATGAWAALDKQSNSFGGLTYTGPAGRYPNTGDVSDAFVNYKNNNWQISAGRFDATFFEFDWLANSIQGIGFKYDNLFRNNVVNKMDIWVTYFNSFLTTGYQPSRIASELGTMYAYHPGGRNFVGRGGGNVIAGGLNMNLAGFVLDPFLLFDINPAVSKDILFQIGTRFGYIVDFAKDWRSSTMLRVMVQVAPDYYLGSRNDVGFLTWIDQEFKYSNWVDFGAGFYYSGGQDIWSINDNSRFYGKWVNSYNKNYFSENVYSFYVFGEFRLLNNKLNIDVLLGGGEYIEFSAIAKYRVWQGKTMKTDVGGGYVYSNLKGRDGDNLLVFAKLSY
ncbi:MAG: hypothetical protein K2P17_07945 [Helicobacteraceae bacterium]|nr:hypothetical protein [Helicobacteraceae bacterium]